MGLIRGSYKWNGIRHELYEPLSILCTNNESRGGILNNVLYGEAPPLRLTFYPFTYHFCQKRFPSLIPFIDKWKPFHIPSLELCIPFNCRKYTVF